MLTQLLLVFLGGAIGASTRFLIELPLVGIPFEPLVLTTIVNLLGAFALGIVSFSNRFGENSRPFLGTGLLGGFTTMSGLALITVSSGASSIWILPIVIFQMALGVILFGLGKKLVIQK